MNSCYQFENQTILEHGLSVESYFNKLVYCLKNDLKLFDGFEIPDIIFENRNYLLDKLSKISKETISLYLVYHDCGKPFCQTQDELGRKHFHNHAEISYNVFKTYFNDDIAAGLILNDMRMHLIKKEEIEDFMKVDNYEVLILSALAELYSNSTMFGGSDSIGYKIKLKAYIKRCKQIFKIKNNN